MACGSSPSSVLPPLELKPLKNELNIKRQWIFTVGQGVNEFYLKLKPVFNGDTGYVIDYKGNLYSFDSQNGKILWQKELNVASSGGLSISDRTLYLGTSKGQVIALNTTDAKELWRTQLSSEILSAPAVSKGIVVAKTIDGRLYGLNSTTGKQSWIYDRSVPRLTLRGNSSPIINNDIVITSSDNGKLSALSLKQGKLLWETTIAIAQGRNELERIIDLDVDPVVIDDVIYIAGYQGRVAAVKIGSGQLIWNRDFSSYSGLYVDAYRVYITDAEGQIWALNRYNGSTLWRQDSLLRRQLTAPQAHSSYIVVGDYDGYLHWINREDGKILARKRINTIDVEIDDEEELDKETALLFSKWNNILVTPVTINKYLLAIDRVGHLEAFSLTDK